jgi:hypothetical protein
VFFIFTDISKEWQKLRISGMRSKYIGKKSECSNCGQPFTVINEERIFYCNPSCESAHDLFKFKGSVQYGKPNRLSTKCY